jgi:uncharacterized protein (DUF1330 family)
MAAYIIADIEIKDAATYDEYRRQVAPAVTKFGGRFIVRGGNPETFEGTWTPKRIIVLEFPTMDALQRWYHSDEYKPLIALRQKAASGNLIAVEGA